MTITHFFFLQLSIAVLLSTREMRRHSFNQLLVALATFDILFIVVSVPVYTYGMFDFMVGNQVSERETERAGQSHTKE